MSVVAGTGGDGGEGGEVFLGEALEGGGGDMLDGMEVVVGELFGDMGEDHLAVALGNLEGAVDGSDEVAHHDIADTL